MTPWIGTDVWISWRGTAQYLRPSAPFAYIETGQVWWITRVDTTGLRYKDFGGVTQGKLLSSTIFNVVVESVVHHWILLVAGGAGGQDGWGREVFHHAAFFYTDD